MLVVAVLVTVTVIAVVYVTPIASPPATAGDRQ
jgi:hypothetical protein